jgi:hypothetical protein
MPGRVTYPQCIHTFGLTYQGRRKNVAKVFASLASVTSLERSVDLPLPLRVMLAVHYDGQINPGGGMGSWLQQFITVRTLHVRGVEEIRAAQAASDFAGVAGLLQTRWSLAAPDCWHSGD